MALRVPMDDVIVFRGARDAAEWALRILAEAGIVGRFAHEPNVMVAHYARDTYVYEILVDAPDAAAAAETLSRAEERSQLAVGVLSERLAHLAGKATLATVLTLAGLELLVGGWLSADSVFYVMGIWAGFFVLLARQDYRERALHQLGRPMA